MDRTSTHSQAAPSTGTTIIACTYRGGVVLGSDGRVSVGNYISNRASNKIAPLADNVFLLRSGSAPDAQMVSDYVSYFVNQMVAESGEEATVELVANLVKTMNYQNKDILVGALIIAGYDAQRGGEVYGCPIGGTLSKEAWAIDGSGSTYIWGFCDNEFREDFTRAEAEAFVIEALGLAMARDSSSGGCIRLVTCDKDGSHHKYLQGDQVPLFIDDLPHPSMAAGGPVGMMV